MAKSNPGRNLDERQAHEDRITQILRDRGMSGVPKVTPAYDPAAGMTVHGRAAATRPECPAAKHRAAHQPDGEVRGVEPFKNMKRDREG